MGGFGASFDVPTLLQQIRSQRPGWMIKDTWGGEPSNATTPAPLHRIEDDAATRQNTEIGSGSTEDLERIASNYDKSGGLAAQVRQSMQPAQPSRMDQMQSQADELGKQLGAGPPKHSLWKDMLAGALAGPRAGEAFARRQQGQEFQQNQLRERQSSLLQQIEAERRMQEQEGMESQREAAAADRQSAAQREMDLRQAPKTIDTDQGPMQWDMNTRQWSPIMRGGQPVGPKAQPKPDSEFQQFADAPENKGKTLSQIVSDYAAASQKPERPGAESGTWQLMEDADGKPVLFNSKTGQTREAPGISKPGTYAKGQGAAQDALNYATTYEKEPPTGPGDYALMMKFVEMTKPSSGFRFTMAEKQMIEQSRSWMQSAEGIAYHAKTGTWFTPEQRSQMIGTMRDVGQSKGSSRGGSQQELTPPSEARQGMKWQHRTVGGKTEWRQVPQ